MTAVEFEKATGATRQGLLNAVALLRSNGVKPIMVCGLECWRVDAVPTGKIYLVDPA